MPIKRLIRRLPFVTAVLRRRYERKVRAGEDWWLWGNFGSYAEALAAAPVHPSKALGYDAPAVATQALEEYEKMHLFDFPALHWLRQFAERFAEAGAGTLKLVDLGGHLGVKYSAYGNYWRFPEGLDWVVLETPTTVAAAEARNLAGAGLRFTTDLGELEGADILFASGSLQYLDWSFLEALEQLQVPPRAIVINKIGVWDFEDRWTLQNVGNAIAPHCFFDRGRFVEVCERAGYEFVDEWRAWETPMRIPYRDPEVPEAQVVGFSLLHRG